MLMTDALIVMSIIAEGRTSDYDLPENNHVRDWGHESDFQFDDDGECGEDLPF